jgi:hypothetical protein
MHTKREEEPFCEDSKESLPKLLIESIMKRLRKVSRGIT